MTNLQGKTALITGSVQGIGLEIARALAGAGAAIAVHGLADAAQAEVACEALRAAGAPDARFFDHDLGVVAELTFQGEFPLTPLTSCHAIDLGGAERVEAVHECDTDVDFGCLSVGVS